MFLLTNDHACHACTATSLFLFEARNQTLKVKVSTSLYILGQLYKIIIVTGTEKKMHVVSFRLLLFN